MTFNFSDSLFFRLIAFIWRSVCEGGISRLITAIIRLVFRFAKFLFGGLINSLFFRIIRAIYNFFKKGIMESIPGRIISKDRSGYRPGDETLLGRALCAVGRGVMRAGSFVVGKVSPYIHGSGAAFIWRHTVGRIKSFDFVSLLGIYIFIILGFPGEQWNNAYGLVLALVLGAIYLFRVFEGKEKGVGVRTMGISFIIFAVSGLFAAFAAASPKDSLRVYTFFVTAFITTVLIAGAVDTKKKLKKLLYYLLLGVIYTGAVGVYQRIVGVEINPSFIDLTYSSAIPGRVFSNFTNPNNFAEILVLTLPLAFIAACLIKNRFVRFFALISLMLPVVSFFATYSRSGWVSFAIAAIVFLFLWDKRLLLVLPLFVLLVIPFLPHTVMSRIGSIGSNSDASNRYRIKIWKAVMEMMKGKWVTGIGMGPDNFYAVYIPHCDPSAVHAPHSHMLYLEVFIEFGLAGALSFFSYMAILIKRGIRSAHTTISQTRAVSCAAVASIVGIMFSCAAEYIWFYPRVLIVFFALTGILQASAAITEKEKRASVSESDLLK